MRPSAAKLRQWREEPVTFVREVFRAEPDAWQAKVLEAFPRHNRLAMKACKGPGKSTIEAWLAWNFAVTRLHPKVVSTSITGDNLRDGLWTELAKWQQVSALLKETFQWQAERITCREHPETWWMSARQWNRGADASQQANTLAGIHADYVLFVIDEAGGVPDAVAAAAEAALSTGIETKLLIGGNPTHLSGPLYRACTTERELWFVVEVTGDPDDPMRSPRISIQWAREQIAKWGRENPWVLVNVFGQFPPAQSNALLGVEDVTAAVKRVYHERDYMEEVKVLGVDIARFGDDRSVAFLRQGRAAFAPTIWRNLDTMQLAGQVSLILDKERPEACFLDVGGVGAGVVDRLLQLGYRVQGVDFGSRPVSPRFVNRRAEMWWAMADWVKQGGGRLPDISELAGELTAPTYDFAANGKLRLESKQDLKDRGLDSPDIADALALTFAAPVASRELRRSYAAKSTAALTDYDPYQAGA